LIGIAHISAISLAFLILISAATSVNAANTNSGPPPATGVPVNINLLIRQDQAAPFANDLHFGVTENDLNTQIAGWSVDGFGFLNGVSAWNPPGAAPGFTADFSGANINANDWTSVRMKIWLTGIACPNKVDIVYWWTFNGVIQGNIIIPIAWSWNFGDQVSSTQWCHLFTIANNDTVRNLTIVNLAFLPSTTVYTDLTTIVFPPPYYNVTILPRQSWSLNVNTTGPFIGGHIYFRYNVTSSPQVEYQQYADHEVTEHTIGGIIAPTNEFVLLAPYIGLASTIMIGAVATSAYVKRVKRRKQKQ
jgi:hypothetical protein